MRRRRGGASMQGMINMLNVRCFTPEKTWAVCLGFRVFSYDVIFEVIR